MSYHYVNNIAIDDVMLRVFEARTVTGFQLLVFDFAECD